MNWRTGTTTVLLLTACVHGAAQAATIGRIDVRGLDPAMTLNVREALSLTEAQNRQVSERRLDYLVEQAQDETREALEPFGYYSPDISVHRAAGAKGAVDIGIDVRPGLPVTVRTAHVEIEGEAHDDRYLQEDLAAFVPRTGDVFDHARYEASKAQVSRRLAERGYFDADFLRRRVEVTRAQHAADIDLAWTSGERYDMGTVSMVQTPAPVVDPRLLERLVYWRPGSYYHQGKLDRLRESLARLDYFSGIDIQPHPDQAVDHRLPVTVTLTPAKRSVYTAGLSYGTDSGAGVRLGVERRYLNMRGHKALAQLDYAERRKTLTLQYRIPAFAWLDGWYTLSAQGADEQTDYIDTRRVELVASRSGQINRELTAAVSLHALRERWAYAADDDGDPTTPPVYSYATFTFPALSAEYVRADNRLQPRNGLGASLMLRTGLGALGSDVNFAQLHGDARWFRGLGAQSRLLLRGELGHTFVDAPIGTMPPSLRFHAGGDRSIRGYAWREVGPRVGPPGAEFPVGARNVVTGSAENED